MKNLFKMALLVMPMMSAGMAMEVGPESFTVENTGLDADHLKFLKVATTNFVLHDAKKGTSENPLRNTFINNAHNTLKLNMTINPHFVEESAKAATTAAKNSEGQIYSYYNNNQFLREFTLYGKGTRKGWRDISKVFQAYVPNKFNVGLCPDLNSESFSHNPSLQRMAAKIYVDTLLSKLHEYGTHGSLFVKKAQKKLTNVLLETALKGILNPAKKQTIADLTSEGNRDSLTSSFGFTVELSSSEEELSDISDGIAISVTAKDEDEKKTDEFRPIRISDPFDISEVKDKGLLINELISANLLGFVNLDANNPIDVKNVSFKFSEFTKEAYLKLANILGSYNFLLLQNQDETVSFLNKLGTDLGKLDGEIISKLFNELDVKGIENIDDASKLVLIGSFGQKICDDNNTSSVFILFRYLASDKISSLDVKSINLIVDKFSSFFNNIGRNHKIAMINKFGADLGKLDDTVILKLLDKLDSEDIKSIDDASKIILIDIFGGSICKNPDSSVALDLIANLPVSKISDLNKEMIKLIFNKFSSKLDKLSKDHLVAIINKINES